MTRAFEEATRPVRGQRSGGRANRQRLRGHNIEQMLPHLRHGLPYTEPMDADQIAMELLYPWSFF